MPTETIPPWVSTFRGLLHDKPAPDFGDDKLFVLSDGSGRSGAHRCRVQSFLIFSGRQSPDWPRLRYELREQFPDERRISYKALSPTSHLQSRLAPFLSVADTLHGWCVTVSVHNSIKRIVTEHEKSLTIWQHIAALEGQWKPAQFENMLRIVHFLSLFLAECNASCKDLEWVSDQDDIFANDERCRDVVNVLRLCLGSYIPNVSGNVRVGPAVLGTAEIFGLEVEDLLAIPDLAAGAIADFVTLRETHGKLPDKAVCILKWLSRSSVALSKCSIEFRPDSVKNMEVVPIETELRVSGS